MKPSQETTSVWNNNQVEPYFFACTNWIYGFLNGDHNMEPKMGPHLSLKTGTEKVKANSISMLHNTAWAACYRNADHFAISCMHALLQSRMLVIMFHEQVVSFRYKLSVFEDCLRILIARAMLEKYFELWCLMLYTKDALHCASSCYYWQSMLRCRHGKLQKFERLELFFFSIMQLQLTARQKM